MVVPLPNFEILSRVSQADLVFRLLTFLELLNSNFYFLFCDLVTRPSSLYLLYRSSRTLHCISAAPRTARLLPRGFTDHVAHPTRSIVLLSYFSIHSSARG